MSREASDGKCIAFAAQAVCGQQLCRVDVEPSNSRYAYNVELFFADGRKVTVVIERSFGNLYEGLDASVVAGAISAAVGDGKPFVIPQP